VSAPNGFSPRLSAVYLWEDIRIESFSSSSGIHERKYEKHALIVAREGAGQLSAGGREYALEFGKCFIFPPGTSLQFNNFSDYPLSAYVLEFYPLTLAGEGQSTIQQGEWGIIPFTRMIEQIRVLYESRHAEEGAEPYRQHLLFQEIIYLVLQSEARKPNDDSSQAVRQTIEFIEASYALDLTLAQLAEMADMSERHYSRLFLKLTGMSPIEYLIKRRLNRAKQLLLTSGDSIQEIAAITGFRDPFHFSRSFKRHMNVSPRIYARLRRQEIRIVCMQYLGDLLALGVTPVGAPELLLKGGYLRAKTSDIAAVGSSVVHPNLARIAELRPDAVLTFDGHHYEDYAHIAPTLSIPWFTPFFERFRFIANWIGKGKEAERWIEEYQAQVAETRRSAMSGLEANATFSFFWMRGLPESFQVYYDMPVLYRDLRLPAPEAVARVQRQEGHEFKEDIPIEEIARYAGDYLFIVVSEDAESLLGWERLKKQPLWRELEAVRRDRVYRLTEDWIMTDPLSLSGQLKDFARMLTERR